MAYRNADYRQYIDRGDRKFLVTRDYDVVKNTWLQRTFLVVEDAEDVLLTTQEVTDDYPRPDFSPGYHANAELDQLAAQSRVAQARKDTKEKLAYYSDENAGSF